MHRVLMEAIAVVVVDGCMTAVDRDLREVRAAEPRQLGVGVREQTSLQQRVIREIDSRHKVTRVESDLFRLREKIVRVAVERHLPDSPHGHQFFRNQFGGIQQIEIELVFVLLLNNLHSQFPFWEVSILDGFPQIA